jgi:MFS family permease
MDNLSARPAQLSARRKRLVLATCCLSLLMVSMDNTIVNVALPSIRRDFQASVSALQWSIDAYTVVIASFLMLAGSTGAASGGAAPSRRASSSSAWGRCSAASRLPSSG